MSFRPAPPSRDDDDTLVMASPPTFSSPRRPAAESAAPCAEVEEALAVGVDGALPLELELHIRSCGSCATRVEEAVELATRVRRAASRYSHPVDFEARVLAAIGSSVR